MPTMASTMPSSRLSPRHVSRKRPRLWLMSFSARFTSRLVARARSAAFAQTGLVVGHDLALHVGRNLDTPVEQTFTELHALHGEPAVLQRPDHARPAVVAFHELEQNEKTARNHLLDDLHFRLLAKVSKLVLRIANPAAHIDAPLFREAIVLLIDADDFRLEQMVRVRSQAHEGGLADT